MSGKFMMNGIEYLGGGSGGGGGNVDDVYVNGVSVLDSDKIAQVVSYKEVTLAEYMALPDTKYTDGIAYFIKDSTEAEGFPPLIYSKEERQIGVWIDGKPLYEKTYDLGSDISISYNSWTEVNANYPTNCGLIIHSDCCTSGGTYASGISVGKKSNGKFEMQSGRNGNNQSIRYFTIQYTKTTDTAGSGIWAGNGAMAHHYSTNEVIVGTWIDGKPVYERTFSKTLASSPDSGGDSFIIAENITYIDTFIKLEGTVKKSNLYAFCSETGLIWAGIGWNYSFHMKSNGQLVVWTGNNSQYYSEVAGAKIVATIRYTKSVS